MRNDLFLRDVNQETASLPVERLSGETVAPAEFETMRSAAGSVTATGHADEQHERSVEWTARYTVVERAEAPRGGKEAS